MLSIEVKELKPYLWPDLEKLFGKRGACAGCWCMFWRHKKGESWSSADAPRNKRRFKKLVMTQKAHGALAYFEGEAVGWVSFDKRKDFISLDRSPSFQCKDDSEKIWSIPCFYIKPGFRSKGVATALLQFAVSYLKKKKIKIIESYPVKPSKSGKPLSAAFAWTGTVPLFQKANFKAVGRKDMGKQRMRLKS